MSIIPPIGFDTSLSMQAAYALGVLDVPLDVVSRLSQRYDRFVWGVVVDNENARDSAAGAAMRILADSEGLDVALHMVLLAMSKDVEGVRAAVARSEHRPAFLGYVAVSVHSMHDYAQVST